MQITQEELQAVLNDYLNKPGLVFIAGNGAMEFANLLYAAANPPEPPKEPPAK